MEEKKVTDDVTSKMKVILSTLWIFVVLNYLYCDVVSLMDSNLLQQYLSGTVGGMQLSQRFLLGASVLMEISIAMVFLSRILKYRANRVINIIAGVLTTIVQILTLIGTPTMYYIFFSAIEITGTIAISIIAYKWKHIQH
jgi:hypothetical protein